MKKVLSLIVFVGVLFISHTSVFGNSYPTTYNFSGNPKITITVSSGTTAEINAVFSPVKGLSYDPKICIVTSNKNDCINDGSFFSSGTSIRNVYDKPATFDKTIYNFDPTKTYYLEVVGPYQNGAQSNFIFSTSVDPAPDKPVPTSYLDGSDVVVSFKVDTTKYPDYGRDTASLVYSMSADLSSPVAGGAIQGMAGPTAGSTYGINKDSSPGAFFWRLSSVKPGVQYYYQITLKTASGTVKSDIAQFNGSVGNSVVPNTASAVADAQKRSYTFLSDNKTVLPDPDLCAQEQAQNPNVHCDLNYYINLTIQFLIGLCGVMLVLRLMYEGFIIMTSDIPFIQVKAKSGFMTALTGLLIALSAWIILNTINPKLVAETVNVQQLSIGISGADGLGTTGTGAASSNSDSSWAKSSGKKNVLTLSDGSKITLSACDTSQLTTTTIFGHSGVEVQKNLVASLQRISNRWQQMSPQYPIKTIEGYNCRTIANSNYISYHSYGLAVDVNADTNGVGTAGDMPLAFIKLWTDEGWGWGGNWNSKKDPMHFSKAIGEQGNMKGE